MKYWPFYLLPFFLLAGVAAQSSGLYLFGIILPAWFSRRNILQYASRIPAGSFAICLIGLYLIFPAFDVIVSFLPLGATIQGAVLPKFLPFMTLIRAPFTNGILVIGFFLAILAILNRDRIFVPSAETSGNETSARVFRHFTRGLTIASVLLLAYVLVQTWSGYDYRSAIAYRPERILQNGWHRPTGFYSHPLSLASVGLALCTFYCSIFWQAIERRDPEIMVKTWEPAVIAAIHFVLVVLSSGRTATLVAIAFMIGILMFSGTSPHHRLWKLVTFLVLAPVILLLSKLSGLWLRFGEFLANSVSLGGDHRPDFWRVHWQIFLDSPLFGQGHAWLNAFKRDAYYEAMGYGALPQKFNAHNIFLEILASTGFVGTTIIIGLTTLFFAKLCRTSKREPIGTLLVRALGLSFAANVVHGLTQNTYFDSNVMIIYLGLFLVLFWSLVDLAPFEARVTGPTK